MNGRPVSASRPPFCGCSAANGASEKAPSSRMVKFDPSVPSDDGVIEDETEEEPAISSPVPSQNQLDDLDDSDDSEEGVDEESDVLDA
jgi:hypothetical protein